MKLLNRNVEKQGSNSQERPKETKGLGSQLKRDAGRGYLRPKRGKTLGCVAVFRKGSPKSLKGV